MSSHRARRSDSKKKLKETSEENLNQSQDNELEDSSEELEVGDPNDICRDCDKIELHTKKGPTCDICRYWFHTKCQGLQSLE